MENTYKKEYYTFDEAKKKIEDTLNILEDKNKTKSIKDAVECLYNFCKLEVKIQGNDCTRVYKFLNNNIPYDPQTHAYIILLNNTINYVAFFYNNDDDDILDFHNKNNNCTILFDLLKNFETKLMPEDILNVSRRLGVLMLKYYNYQLNFMKEDDVMMRKYYVHKILKYHVLGSYFSFFDPFPDLYLNNSNILVLDAYNHINDNLVDKEKIKIMEKEIEKLKAENENLKIELKYQPNGDGMKEHEESFYSIAKIMNG